MMYDAAAQGGFLRFTVDHLADHYARKKALGHGSTRKVFRDLFQDIQEFLLTEMEIGDSLAIRGMGVFVKRESQKNTHVKSIETQEPVESSGARLTFRTADSLRRKLKVKENT